MDLVINNISYALCSSLVIGIVLFLFLHVVLKAIDSKHAKLRYMITLIALIAIPVLTIGVLAGKGVKTDGEE